MNSSSFEKVGFEELHIFSDSYPRVGQAFAINELLLKHRLGRWDIELGGKVHHVAICHFRVGCRVAACGPLGID